MVLVTYLPARTLTLYQRGLAVTTDHQVATSRVGNSRGNIARGWSKVTDGLIDRRATPIDTPKIGGF